METKHTAWDLAQELSSFTTITSGVQVLSTNSDLNDKVTSSRLFEILLMQWSNVIYDEDPNFVMNELEYIINDTK